MSWLRKHFSVNAWGPYIARDCGDVWLLGLNFDWLQGNVAYDGYASATVRLLGFVVCLTFWPRGKA